MRLCVFSFALFTAGYLKDHERVQLAGLFKLKEYKKNELVFKQGEVGAGAFILHKVSAGVLSPHLISAWLQAIKSALNVWLCVWIGIGGRVFDHI
jgi:hypothetical protein